MHIFPTKKERMLPYETRSQPYSIFFGGGETGQEIYARVSSLFLALVLTTVPALAVNDPLAAVNNLSDFIFSLIRAIGLILLGFGILQVGLSLKSHDPSQRANGMLTVAGGIVITFTKEILTLVTGG